MKKVLICVIVVFAIMFVSLSTTAETIEKDKGYVSVNASTTKEISPNLAEITIVIETSDKSLNKASEENKVIANKVYSSLKSMLGNDDYIRTNKYNARPVYIYTRDNKRIFDKYVVSNSVIVKTKKLDLVLKFIDTAISLGANSISNLQFSADNYDDMCNETLADLTKKAYSQANSVAKSINNQIIGVRAINTTCNLENFQRPLYAMAGKAAEDSNYATPIESGKIKIYANIDASFYVK